MIISKNKTVANLTPEYIDTLKQLIEILDIIGERQKRIERSVNYCEDHLRIFLMNTMVMVRRKANMTRTTLRMTKSTESKINYFEAKLENNPALIKNIPSSNNGLINMLLNDYLTLIINAWNKKSSKKVRNYLSRIFIDT